MADWKGACPEGTKLGTVTSFSKLHQSGESILLPGKKKWDGEQEVNGGTPHSMETSRVGK